MASERRVVVYGASGYTGKLVAENLAKRGIAFVAAGRNLERLEASLAELDGADAVAKEAPHTVEGLTELFAGAKVVINVTGPFAQLGRPVVQAALNAQCHYLDTTGEQDFVLGVKEEFHEAFAAKDLLLHPAMAWMWTAGLLAAEVCLETEGIDSVDLVYLPNGQPTIASTKSFLRMASAPNNYLEDNAYVAWPEAVAHDVIVPGSHRVYQALSWGGGCEPVWFHDDDRVRNCTVLTALRSPEFVAFMVQSMKDYLEKKKTMSPAELEEMTNALGDAMSATPPREQLEVNRYIISCHGRGTNVATHCLLHGTAPYLQTGFLCSEGAQRLLDGRAKAFGFVSAAKAFGARDLLDALHKAGLQCKVP